MDISSVTSNVNTLNAKNANAVQPQNQTARAREVEGDKDKDDGAAKAAAQAAPRQSVNTSGQIVGRLIDVRA